MVHLQLSLEDGLHRALGPDDPRLILCHRGTLDPLAYWLDRGWPEDEFFAFTETQRQDLYRRYTAAIHLVTAADGAAWAYKKWPEAHRPEEPADAIRIDRLLQQAWGGHRNYYRIDNEGRDWQAKSGAARESLARWLCQNPLTEILMRCKMILDNEGISTHGCARYGDRTNPS